MSSFSKHQFERCIENKKPRLSIFKRGFLFELCPVLK